MDRRRLLGVALAAASACGYGSGALFAKSVYGAGIDWLALLYWRFLIAGALVWAWTLLMADNRAALRALPRRRVVALLGLGAFFVGNASTYYASLQYVSASLAARPGVCVAPSSRRYAEAEAAPLSLSSRW